jgi:Serine kinase of the HPr protein, regulates carbohydrate metabolism
MPGSYAVCGVGLQFDAPIAALKDLPRPGRVDVRVTLGSLPPGVAPAQGRDGEYFVDSELEAGGRPWMSAARVGDAGHYRLSYAEGVTIVVAARGEAVWVAWREGLCSNDACVYLTGSALGFVLRLRGIACLHGSAVAIAGDAVAVLGPSGSGKSTTAAAFARSGYAVLSDDLARCAKRTRGSWSIRRSRAWACGPGRRARSTCRGPRCRASLRGGTSSAFRSSSAAFPSSARRSG